ncbi:hypothetical protein HanRHA438_Chr11g0517471 [Helianthus annuus]|nr:hypothetical protein HanRHA438_Chr11g0517471 [Helianthus annuus]
MMTKLQLLMMTKLQLLMMTKLLLLMMTKLQLLMMFRQLHKVSSADCCFVEGLSPAETVSSSAAYI